MNVITNPNPNRCPEIGDLYHLVDICPNVDVQGTFAFLDNLVENVNTLPNFLIANVDEACSHVIHTFIVPMYIDMERFFNLPDGTIFKPNYDPPFTINVNRIDQTVEIQEIDSSFDRPDKGVDLGELLDTANISGRMN